MVSDESEKPILRTAPEAGPVAEVVRSFETDLSSEAAGRFLAVALRYFAGSGSREAPVSTARTYEEIAANVTAPPPREGKPLDEVVRQLEHQVVREANHFIHPMYMGHQLGPPLPTGVWTELVVAALNQSVTVFGMSPTATAIERQVIHWLADLARLGPLAGGTFTSGGSEANFTALLAARASAIPHVWRDGIPSDAPVVICGDQSHYSISRAVAELGLGSQRVVTVRSRDWKIDVDALEDLLKDLERRGKSVMAVVATAGSTATGSFDDLEGIGALCDARGIWMHVDGAHGASALFSDTHRVRVAGIHRARTVTWDPHKLMLVPLSAGTLLARDERDLEAAFRQHATYVFGSAAHEQRPGDQGLRSFMCSRRADALKAWVVVQRYGIAGLGRFYDHFCAAARRLYQKVLDHPSFETVHEPECNILCFRWVGDRNKDAAELDAANSALHEAYNRSGRGWITSTVLEGRTVLRATVTNTRTTEEDRAELLNGLTEVARQIG